ncbi:cytochrome b [Jiella avicenniae]|uniref:Cytochrome b/b6 domain-containing protein n=1 Tax=Jiella avicenniae TaxID=2907202 RepID=A0A9X1NXH5_9HYPH|nr:cytochrome b/b6 domain-containing protein [Jiella avicenniae]MCE7027397.1 cytochrome b/b6 domain-containing protein [Jiella avicenniae]
MSSLAPSHVADAARYRPAARVLHWLVALLVLVVWPVGFVIHFVKDEAKTGFYVVHESFGFLILWLMLARLAVRLVFPPPPEVEMPLLQRRVAVLVHWLLYAALVLQPIFGFLSTNAFGFPLDWFGLVTVWSPIGKSDLAPSLMSVHVFLGWSILVLFCLHFAGVLHHHVIRRDATLHRML